MKRHLSVFLLAGRGSAHWFLLMLPLMAAAEVALLFFLGGTVGELPFDQWIEASRVRHAFIAALAIQTALSIVTMLDQGGHTTRRLSVSENMVILWHTLYNVVCYLVLWGVQLLLLLGFLSFYLKEVDPSYLNHQSVVLAFYRDSFLHAIMPQAHTGLYLRNVALFLFMALGAAGIVQGLRVGDHEGKKESTLNAILIWAGLECMFSVFVFFPHSINSGLDGTGFIVVLAILLALVVGLLQWGRRKLFKAGGEVPK